MKEKERFDIVTHKDIYTVNELSKLASVSIRTLHHYDEIDLLKPNRNPRNGYREYTYRHLVLLQQILIYRELEFSTSNIKDLLQSKNHDLLETLISQKELLIGRQKHFETLISKIEESIQGLDGQANIDILYRDIPKEKAEQWEALARDRYGQEYFEENMARIKSGSEAELQKLKELGASVGKRMSCLLQEPVDSEKVCEVVKLHIHWMSQLSSTTNNQHPSSTYDSVVKFASSLANVKELAALYDMHGEGTAAHLSEALYYYAQENLR